MITRSLVQAGVIAVAVWAGRAEAASPDVALTELDFEGAPSADDRTKLRRALLAAVGERLLPVAAGDPSSDARVEHLNDDRQRIELGKHFGARLLMEATATQRKSAAGKTAWTLVATLFDTEGAEPLGSEESACDACTADDVVKRVGPLVARLLARDRHRPTGRLTVREPAGVSSARLAIDRRPMGYLPFDETVFAGNHELAIEAEGYRPSRQTVLVPAGATLHVAPVLERGGFEPVVAATAPHSPPPRSPALRIAGATLIPVGAGGVIAGAVLLSMNGDAACAVAPGMTRCPSRYNNTAVGAALVSVGAVAAIGGAVVLALDAVARRRASTASVHALVDVNGAGVWVGARGRF